MKVYDFHYHGEYDSHPDEDAESHNNGWFAVFDGVTLAHQEPYPDPSPAAQAAQIACKAVTDAKFDDKNPEESLRRAAAAANRAIRGLNESLGITGKTVDFLKIQYAAAVGAFGYIKDGNLYAAQINDSELAVLNSDGSFRFRLETIVGPINRLLESRRNRGDFTANSPEEHRFARKEIINNTKLEFDGQPIRAGVLTGQAAAMGFLDTGSVRLSADDTILVYSDGMIPYVEDEVFRKYLASSPDFADFDKRQRTFEAPHRERTMIIIREPI